MSRDEFAAIEREVEAFAEACIRNQVRPTDAIGYLREAWALKLDDFKRTAEWEFEAARTQRKP